MSTVTELARYCNEIGHQGALLFTGEFGSGKTYLIENDLSKELEDTHIIVRISLFGIDNAKALNDAVRNQWFLSCTPILGKLKKERDKLESNNIFTKITSVFTRKPNVSLSGVLAAVVLSFDPMDYVRIEPEVTLVYKDENKKKHKLVKKVVLVFDDLDRSKMDWVQAMGNINDYCENQDFKTIIIANNEKYLSESAKNSASSYKVVTEKIVARKVLNLPDYKKIVHNIIVAERMWQSREYTIFLYNNEDLILDIFSSDPPTRQERMGKYHNIRSLIVALKEFYRVFEVLTKYNVPNQEKYLNSFVTYTLISKNGICKDGNPYYDVTEEQVKQLYPDYDPAYMPASIQQWVEYGNWNDEQIIKDLTASNIDG